MNGFVSLQSIVISTFLVSVAVAQDQLELEFYFPSNATWEQVSCEDAGVDEERLKRALDFAGEKNSGGVVVLWNGRILAERYWNGWDAETTHAIYSASKSVVSTLVGMAIDEGKIVGPEESASVYLSEWQGQKGYEAITLDHLLSMSSGLEGGRQNFLKGALVHNEREFATRLPIEATPGTRWDYHNSAYRLLFSVIEEATGESLQRFTERKLLDPVGMRHTKWETKRISRSEYTFLSASTRDAARFGLLALAKGKWAGKQLVSEQWLQRATTPAHPEVNPSYGYLWWLNGGEFYFRPLRGRRLKGPILPDVPEDAFAALGKDDQKIYVVPSLGLVVAWLGETADDASPALSNFDATFLGGICASCTDR